MVEGTDAQKRKNESQGEAPTGDASINPEEATAQNKKLPKWDWRTNVLATPRVKQQKYVKPVDKIETGVSPSALKAEPQPSDTDRALPNLRFLYVNKRSYEGNPAIRKSFDNIMEKHIHDAWNTPYNEYKKARRDKRLKELARKEAKKGKKKKGKGKKGSSSKAKTEKQVQEWVDSRSQPKPVPKPEKIERGKIADLDKMKARIDTLATAPFPREKYVPKPPPKHIVNEDALTYVATERILEIAKPPAHRIYKKDSYVLGSVKRSALKYQTREWDKKAATPRARANANDADLKEDPFAISPNALKYKATPRINELAQPVERS